jgi:hypothetical protein
VTGIGLSASRTRRNSIARKPSDGLEPSTPLLTMEDSRCGRETEEQRLPRPFFLLSRFLRQTHPSLLRSYEPAADLDERLRRIFAVPSLPPAQRVNAPLDLASGASRSGSTSGSAKPFLGMGSGDGSKFLSEPRGSSPGSAHRARNRLLDVVRARRARDQNRAPPRRSRPRVAMGVAVEPIVAVTAVVLALELIELHHQHRANAVSGVG